MKYKEPSEPSDWSIIANPPNELAGIVDDAVAIARERKMKSLKAENAKLRARLAEAEAERNRLASAIENVIRSQPCSNEGTLFYPHFDPDGNELGIECVDPLTVLGGIYIELASALAAKSEGK